jgi:hypothetical protein
MQMLKQAKTGTTTLSHDRWFPGCHQTQPKREMLTTILTGGIQAWLTEATLQPGTYPHVFRQLIQEQNDIGWRQFFNGRISNKWQRLQNEHLRRHGITTIK